MEEITYTNGFCDIMINIDETGKVEDIYTYKRDLPDMNIEGSWQWQQESNPIFIHLNKDQIKDFWPLLQNDNSYTYL